jgi:hypothetical protein
MTEAAKTDSKLRGDSQETSRKEVRNLYSVVTEIVGVLSLFGVTQCYSYRMIKGVIINCNSAWRISNKSLSNREPTSYKQTRDNMNNLINIYFEAR